MKIINKNVVKFLKKTPRDFLLSLPAVSRKIMARAIKNLSSKTFKENFTANVDDFVRRPSYERETWKLSRVEQFF